MKKLLLDYELRELEELFASLRQPSYRAKQLLSGYYRALSLDGVTNLPLAVRERLKEELDASPVEIARCLESLDGTRKYLFRLRDGNVVEGVLMKYRYGNTLCISTQVGCRMGCAFCASTIGGLVRDLTGGEMLGEVLAVNREQGGGPEGRAVTNVVLMGSGEPLDNFENTLRFIRLVTAPEGIGISRRNLSLSTCGIAPRIRELAEREPGVTLSISLHAADDETRRRIMPVAKVYPVCEILDAAKYYYRKTGRRVIFEYSVINGVNMGNARALAELVKGFPSHVNLILLNPVEESSLCAPDKKAAYRFMGELQKLGVSVSLRRQLGGDIAGACGQLRRNYLQEKLSGGDDEHD